MSFSTLFNGKWKMNILLKCCETGEWFATRAGPQVKVSRRHSTEEVRRTQVCQSWVECVFMRFPTRRPFLILSVRSRLLGNCDDYMFYDFENSNASASAERNRRKKGAKLEKFWLLEYWQCLSQTWGVTQLSLDIAFLLLGRLFLDLNLLFQTKEQVIVASGMIRNRGMV